MSGDKPFFRFHPHAYEHERGAFVESDQECDVCGRPSVWLYSGGIYVGGDEPAVCARCIADGQLAKHLDGDFGMHDAEFSDDVDEALGDEVMQRTPGFATFYAFEWPVIDGKPLAYIGHGQEEGLWRDPAAAAAVRAMHEEETGEPLKGTTPYALVFRELDGPAHVAIVDLD